MGATTPNLSLYKPGGGSSGTIVPDERVDVDRLNDNSDKIDAFAGTMLPFRVAQLSRNQQFTGLAADIGTVSGMKLGDTYQETDGKKISWRYDGANWISNESSGFLVRPTAVVGTGVTINDSGAVDFSSSSSVAIDGLFTSRFSQYEIVVEVDSAGADGDISMTLRVGGSAASATTYASSGVEVSIGAGPTRRESNTLANLGRFAAAGGVQIMTITNSMEAKSKFVTFQSFDRTVFSRTGGVSVTSAQLCDGISFGFTSPATGNIKVYGKR